MQPWVIKHVLFLPSVWVEGQLQFSSRLSCRTDRAAPGRARMTPLQCRAAAVAAPWASCSLPPCDALSLAQRGSCCQGELTEPWAAASCEECLHLFYSTSIFDCGCLLVLCESQLSSAALLYAGVPYAITELGYNM